MTSAPLSYWTPGSEERQLRIFISHRYGKDQALYDEVLAAVRRNGFSVQDISLSAEQVMAGPRGGDLPKLEIQAEIAARIYTSNILIAPSRPAVGRSQWVTWEVQLAAIGYGIPILFVDLRNHQRRTRLVSEVDSLGLRYATCEPDIQNIARKVAELVDGRPDWAMRQAESDGTLRFRGPPTDALNDVLRKFPFQPRLNSPEPLPPPSRLSFWSRLSGRHP